uniref:Ig-like domain-containing protein n=1 Tax=Ficedula albicollis TaxID=59894 RepID=U3K042_FICAL
EIPFNQSSRSRSLINCSVEPLENETPTEPANQSAQDNIQPIGVSPATQTSNQCAARIHARPIRARGAHDPLRVRTDAPRAARPLWGWRLLPGAGHGARGGSWGRTGGTGGAGSPPWGGRGALGFDSDVGRYEGFTPFGERNAGRWNSDPEFLEQRKAAVDTYCRYNYRVSTPFLVERRVPPSVSISLMPSSSQPGPDRLLCSVMDFYPAQIQVRWLQGQQELSEHVVATDVVANGDWTYQLLVLLETPPRRGLSYTCQVEHVSLEQPLRQRWGTGEALGGCQRHWDVLGATGRDWERHTGISWWALGGSLWVLDVTGREFGGAGFNWEGVWGCWV